MGVRRDHLEPNSSESNAPPSDRPLSRVFFVILVWFSLSFLGDVWHWWRFWNLDIAIAAALCCVIFSDLRSPSRWRVSALAGSTAVGIGMLTSVLLGLMPAHKITFFWPRHDPILFCSAITTVLPEEILFRGLLLETLIPRSAILGVIAVSVLAASLHSNFVFALIIHGILALLYVKYRSLTVSGLCHLTINVCAFIPILQLR